ncbi:MAG: FtsX-like permease family protein, partial [Gemmatimonadetes bacterium]|nr:FtsX-like permease family protein [Gemmatimonadota bacterium]NIR75078.1 FtsX-like permease family protein [Candidatus Kutchimonas denitrificans]NIS00910.1 FtsX-like permease family protein [Gemmatimonadota bacterium]NIT66527.1 FtsX-like permease family protein [Gemmatimonadota bacterium]NIU52873.1 FtsX-like permease family protein [Gemmatimonadota bacterium]
MRNFLNDIRYALRGLHKQPGFTAVIVVTLALGIGSTSAIFSVVNGVLLKPLPYPEPDRLVRIWDASGRFGLTEPEYIAFRQSSGPLSSLAISVPWQVDLTAEGWEPERLPMAFVSSEFLSTLRVAPAIGRDFTRQDMDPNADPVTILTDGLWRRRFGGEPQIVGRTITLNDRAVRVVGILPPEFEYPGAATALLLPYFLNESSPNTSDRFLVAVGRLLPGVTPEQARIALEEMNERYRERAERLYGKYNNTETFHVVPLRDELVGAARRALWLLLAAAGFVLLIACGNIGGMLVVRGETRMRDMAIRRALGAGWGQLVRQLLTESLLLAALGGVAGILLATWGTELLTAVAAASVPRLDEISVDARVLAFGTVLVLLVGVAAGALPAFRLGSGLEARLRAGGERAGAGIGRSRLRRALVTS